MGTTNTSLKFMKEGYYMTSEKLTQAIAKEEKQLAGYKKKRAEYDEKIKRSEAKLQQYQMMQRSEQFTAVSTAVAQNGLSIEDILTALQSGDLLALQEQMEAAQAAAKEIVSNADSQNEEETDEESFEII